MRIIDWSSDVCSSDLGHNPDDYETQRIFATAPDGERVPVTLLYRKGIKRDGTAPALLYGYGAYGISLPASFSVSALSLVARGSVRSDERRVGQEGVSTCSSRWSPDH